MVDPVLDAFDLVADLRLEGPNEGNRATGGRLAEVTASCVRQVDGAIEEIGPGCIVVQGDTVTAMATSLAAFYRRVRLVHVEAGLRTGNLESPWPEELNRRIISMSAAIHCAPTVAAAATLKSEGIPEEAVHVTGNTVVDALNWTLSRQQARSGHWSIRHRDLGQRRVVLITAHRRENVGRGIHDLCLAVERLAERFPDVRFVFPVHCNPEIQEVVRRSLTAPANVKLMPALAYAEFIWMLDRAEFLLTDSGGALEEAVSLGKFSLITRDTTERPEALQVGLARLVGTTPSRIVREASEILQRPPVDRAPPAQNPFGDGQAARRIVEILRHATSAPQDELGARESPLEAPDAVLT